MDSAAAFEVTVRVPLTGPAPPGPQLTVAVVEAPGARVPVPPDSVKPAEGVTAEIATVPVPAFFRVTVLEAFCPTVTSPKAIEAGVAVRM
jgi:hypothetical protein